MSNEDVREFGPVAMSVEHLEKSFDERRVLTDLHVAVRSGEMKAVLGSNGSGKSTFVKILTGTYPFPRGTVRYGDQTFQRRVPSDALEELGVRVVHQEAPLPEGMTVAEVVGLNRGFPTVAGLISWRRLRAMTRDLLASVAADVDPSTPVEDLSAGQRATVALALALHGVEAPSELVLLLDEATASILAAEASGFLESVRALADQGAAVIIITHRLGEVTEFCDTVAVLRDGVVVLDTAVGATTEAELVTAMAGPDAGQMSSEEVLGAAHVDRFVPDRRSGSTSAALTVERLTGEAFRDVAFVVRPGEVVGVPRVVGSGASEMLRAIAGVERSGYSGSVTVAGARLVPSHSAGTALDHGIAYLPADRLHEGGLPEASVRDNLALPRFNEYWGKAARQRADETAVIGALDVRPPDTSVPFGTLSGGNQQKVILGKLLLARPRVVLLDDPTVGVDPNAREAIFSIIRAVTAAGAAVVMASTEPIQLARLCDRVLIMREGVIRERLEGADLDYERISLACAV